MQIFEVVELEDYPFMATVEVYKADIVRNNLEDSKAYLIVDSNSKVIMTFNAQKCPIKFQVYGAILAKILNKQLEEAYKVDSLNRFEKSSQTYNEIMNKLIGGGKAKPITIKDFPKPISQKNFKIDIKLQSNIKINKIIDYIYEIPSPERHSRKFMILGGNIYAEEERAELFVKEKKHTPKPVKMGRLNNGFNFFDDRYYSTRFIVKEPQLQAIELFVSDGDKPHFLELTIPVIQEEKFSNAGKIESLIDAFRIPVKIKTDNPEEIKREKLIKNIKDNANEKSR